MKINERIMLEGTRSDLIKYFKKKFKSGEWDELGNDKDPTCKTTIAKQLDKCTAIIQGEEGALWGKVGLVFVMKHKKIPHQNHAEIISVWVRIYPDYYWEMQKDKHEMGII